MKRMMIILTFISLGFILTKDTPAKTNFGGGVYFYSELSPYGTWIELSTGITVWRPAGISANWVPYSDGQWVWTDDGWYWDSYEQFGYVTYHYGRWYFDDYYGWIWIPDNEWAPSWVEWRYDDDYIGWAPLPPSASFSIYIGIHFTTEYHNPYYHWRFIRYRYMCDPYGYQHYADRTIVYNIYNRTKYRTNYGYSGGRVINRGIDVDFVRRRSGNVIREKRIDRISDAREIRNNNERNSDRIRTFNPGKENITRQNVDERKIDRSGRSTTLDYGRNETENRNFRNENNGNVYNRNRDNTVRDNNGRNNYNSGDRTNNNLNPRTNRENVTKETPRTRTIVPRSDNNIRSYNPQGNNTNRTRNFVKPGNNNSNNNRGNTNRGSNNRSNNEPRKRGR